ncbi:ATP-grasp domain-containing protein [Bradyrhizobium sp.]|uniref:ATP-grasp domain-containing protein n=1 Tax=Bradyrhizobium sp. TaxID=376 RepID=UPI003C691099
MRPEPEAALSHRSVVPRPRCAERIGLARLTRAAEAGHDLRPLWRRLISRLLDGTIEAGEGLDLSVIAQLLGDKEAGLAIQNAILSSHQLFRSPCAAKPPRLRVLALAAATDIGSNTPIEFLLESSGIELTTLYVMPDIDWPDWLPDHDVAMVIASDSEDCRNALDKIADAMTHWPRPLLNPPQLIGNLDRDRLHGLLDGIAGLEIPPTIGVTREQLSLLSQSRLAPSELSSGVSFPVIARPLGSHAGKGLAKLDDAVAVEHYLDEHPQDSFFVSRFVDYRSDDGLFRKYRIVFIDGQPYACHLAIAGRWDIWYLNAAMADSADKRNEEATFMRTFDSGFAQRHRAALAGLSKRIGLDYFTVDCAETKQGSLLIFEADNTAIVHDMDPPDVFPYKVPQMRKVFDAFAAMLHRRAGRRCEAAA